jgi:hypothetical protein
MDYENSEVIDQNDEIKSVRETKLHNFALYFRGYPFNIKNFELNEKLISQLKFGNTLFQTKLLSTDGKNYKMSLHVNANSKDKIIERGVYFLKSIGVIENPDFEFDISYDENTNEHHVFNVGYIPLVYILYLRDVFISNGFVTEANGSQEVFRKPFEKHNLSETELNDKIATIQSMKNKWDSYDDGKKKELLLDYYGYCMRPTSICSKDDTFLALDGSRLRESDNDKNRFLDFIKNYSKTKHSLCRGLTTLFACEGGMEYYATCPLEWFLACNDLWPRKGEYRGLSFCSKGYTPLWLTSAIYDAMVEFNVTGCKLGIH